MQDLAMLGHSAEVAQAWLQSQQPLDVPTAEEEDGASPCEPGAPMPVWPENHEAFKLFMRLQCQWHRTPTGGLDGLRYEAVNLVMGCAKLADPHAVLLQIEHMQHAVLRAQNKVA